MRAACHFAAIWLSAGLALAARPAPAGAAPPNSAPARPALEFFETRVRPVLAENCFACHGEKRQRAGLRLDSGSAVRQGGDDGPVVMPGDPDKSLLLRAVRYTGELKMPPKHKLPDEAIQALTRWVQMGAPWPDEPKAGAAKGGPDGVAYRKHLAFQPVKKPPMPAVRNAGWVQTPIDCFILARLEVMGLTPAPAADRRTLLRRASFDLLGLPPTPEELAAFEADPSPAAFAKVVDRLLASPRYGERWGRHWLDVARYADTKGYLFEQERRYPYAYTYRDYVIRALNEDKPYDRFILEQLAADRLLLEQETNGRVAEVESAKLRGIPALARPRSIEDSAPATQARKPNQRMLAALGFLTLGRRFLNNPHDIIDDRIDVTTRGLLGLTVSCARCHDHKFDPIPQRDYYSLYGVFASSVEPRDLPLIAEPERTPAYLAFAKELRVRQQKVTKFLQRKRAELLARKTAGVSPATPPDRLARFFDGAARNELVALRRRVEHWQATSPAAPPRAMVLQDAPVPVAPHVFQRGNPQRPGPEVPRQFLAVLAGDQRQPFHDGSGRLELARAIASKDNPLTARVLVNRAWLHHFGSGLVRTPSDFGLRGEPPTHPELLDWLAATFMENGWSIKKLHRLIMLSSAYQQASDTDPRQARKDPENRLLGRMNRQRLEFEALRDSLLAVAGTLDAKGGGRAVDLLAAPFSSRRSVYGFIDRQNLPGLLRTFDFASPDTTSPQRHTTTVPQQALFLMNSPFVVEQARRLATRPDVAGCALPEQRIGKLHQLLYGRAPDREEVAFGLGFLQQAGSEKPGRNGLGAWEKYAQVLLLANEFVYVD